MFGTLARVLFRLGTLLGTLILGVWVVDEVIRIDRAEEIDDPSEQEAEVLDDLLKRHGEGFSVYNNEGNSGYLILAPPYQGVLNWRDGR